MPSVLLLHALGVLSHQAHAQDIKKKPSFISNMGSLEGFNHEDSESPTASKIAELAPKKTIISSHPPSLSKQKTPSQKESLMTDEELEFLLFGSITEAELTANKSEKNDFI